MGYLRTIFVLENTVKGHLCLKEEKQVIFRIIVISHSNNVVLVYNAW